MPKVRLAGTLSVTVATTVVAPVPVFVTFRVYVTGVPTVNIVLLAVLDIVSTGPPITLLLTEAMQRATAGQVLSPPPLTLAVLVSVLPTAAAVGVTGMTKELSPLATMPAAMTQVATCPAAVQPAGMAPNVRPAGIVSVTVATAVVAVTPMFVTVSV